MRFSKIGLNDREVSWVHDSVAVQINIRLRCRAKIRLHQGEIGWIDDSGSATEREEVWITDVTVAVAISIQLAVVTGIGNGRPIRHLNAVVLFI